VQHPPGSQAAVNQSLKSLNANEANAVQATLLKVRMSGEGRSQQFVNDLFLSHAGQHSYPKIR
jgi:hypothetical protein